ncbi:hypothetical protein [Tahibacter sp.]|uniref:hypothetical protein n=1 Tax=Tahibacter sp. TaxID=2056211 RepID=UPI0028C428F1|nr:hypothetical protein [Tahibacter sp.]
MNTQHRPRAGRYWLAAFLLSLGAASAASELVEASNGSAVGPLLQTPHGDELFALLDLGGSESLPYGELIFASRYEAGPAPQGFVEVFLGRDGIEHPYAPYVYFAAPACEGQAFVSKAATHPARGHRAAIVGHRAELYLTTSDVASLQTVSSQLTTAGCRPFQHVIRAYPVRSAGDLLDRLPPPYRIGTSG